jgi:hypothetical protein
LTRKMSPTATALGLTALAQGDLQRAMELLKAMETNP